MRNQLWHITNGNGDYLMEIDYFCNPPEPIFTESIEDAKIFDDPTEANGLLAHYHANPAFRSCVVEVDFEIR